MGTAKLKIISFFCLALALLASIFFVSRAAAFYPTQIQLQGRLEKNGKITFDRNLLKSLPQKPVQKVFFGIESDRVQLKIIDNPGYEISAGHVEIDLTKVDPKYLNQISAKSFAIHGIYASTEQKTAKKINYESSYISESGIWTVEVILPKKALSPSLIQKIFFWSANYSIVWLLVSTALIIISIFTILFLLWKRFQLERIRPTKIISQAPPSDLSPAALTILEEKKAAQRAIAAGILYLAIRGYLTVIKKSEGFVVAKNKEPGGLSGIDRDLYNLLIGKWFAKSVKEIDIENSRDIFNQAAGELHQKLYQELIKFKFFVEDPWLVTHKTRLIGVILFIFSVVGFFVSLLILPYPPYAVFVWLALALIALFIIRIATLMPLRSQAGVLERQKWFSFKKYLSNPTNATVGYDLPMDMYLPYAIALKCEKKWILRFNQTQYRVPSWYVGPSVTVEDIACDIVAFVDQFARTIDAAVPPEAV